MSYTLRNLIIAAALAVVGMVLVGSYLKTQQQQLERGNEYVKILVADKDIPAGTSAKAIEAGDYVKLQRVLERDKQPQALTNLKAVTKLSTSRTILLGDQVTSRSFATVSNLNLADAIKGTERQLALPLGPFQGVANNLRPGDRIDIFATGTMKTGDGEAPVTFIAARDVLIVSTPTSRIPEGQESEATDVKAGADFEIYMVQVSDKVASDLIHSYSLGSDVKLWSSLRPSDGAQETNLKPLLGIPKNT